MKILGAVLELPAKQHCQFIPFISKLGQIGSAVYLVAKTAPRILIFLIAMGADYSFYVKSIATFALIYFGYFISVLASVSHVCNSTAYWICYVYKPIKISIVEEVLLECLGFCKQNDYSLNKSEPSTNDFLLIRLWLP